MGAKAELLQGTLDMLILKALSLGELHGYGIIQRIQQISDGLLVVEQGSLYPALYRMEQQGWISSEWGQSEVGRQGQALQTNESRPQATGIGRIELGSAHAGDLQSHANRLKD